MAEISVDSGLPTYINVFWCEPENQAALVETLAEETETRIRQLPGFVSANIHASRDGRRVCNYAQWTSVEAFDRMMATEEGPAMIARVRQYATNVDIHIYHVARQYEDTAPARRAGGRARDLVDNVWSAIDTGDIESLGRYFRDDVEFSTVTGAGRGIDYVKRVFTMHRKSYPDLSRELLSSVESPDGDSIALEWRFTGTQLGDLRTPWGTMIPPSGKQLKWTSSDHIRVELGRIVSWHAWFDRMTLADQLGLLPLPEPAR